MVPQAEGAWKSRKLASIQAVAEIDQILCLDQLACRKPDQTPFGAAGLQIVSQDDSEIVLAGPIDDAVLVIETFHRANLGTMRRVAVKMAAHAALAGRIRAIFGEVQHSGRIGICADPQHAAASPAEAVERRARPVIVMPRCIYQQLLRKPAAGAEAARRIVRHQSARALSEPLGKIARLVECGRRLWIEKRGLREQFRSLGLRQAIDVVVFNLRAEDHQEVPSPRTASSTASSSVSGPLCSGPIARSDAWTMSVSPARTRRSSARAFAVSGGCTQPLAARR
jgi:hypothetical protein